MQFKGVRAVLRNKLPMLDMFCFFGWLPLEVRRCFTCCQGRNHLIFSEGGQKDCVTVAFWRREPKNAGLESFQQNK